MLKFYRGFSPSMQANQRKELDWDYLSARASSKLMVERFGPKTVLMGRVLRLHFPCRLRWLRCIKRAIQ